MPRRKEIVITIKGKTGLSRTEIDEVLKVIKKARTKGLLPALTYGYNLHTFLFGKDPIYIRPKTGSVGRAGVKIRSILRKEFGSKYSIRLG